MHVRAETCQDLLCTCLLSDVFPYFLPRTELRLRILVAAVVGEVAMPLRELVKLYELFGRSYVACDYYAS